jgi:hypothetical protein
MSYSKKLQITILNNTKFMPMSLLCYKTIKKIEFFQTLKFIFSSNEKKLSSVRGGVKKRCFLIFSDYFVYVLSGFRNYDFFGLLLSNCPLVLRIICLLVFMFIFSPTKLICFRLSLLSIF